MPRVFGILRFSYVPEEDTAYRVTGGKPFAERARLILDPARLSARFRLFEALCLPALAAQPPDRFAAILLTSEAMPASFADRLRALVAPHPNIHAVFAPPKVTRTALREALAPHAPSDGLKLTFRLDDDDAVAADFTERLERYLKPEYEGHCVSFYRGLGICRLYGRVRLWERQQYMASAGLAFVNAAAAPETVYDCQNHRRVAESYPTLVDGRGVAFLQSSHGWNDAASRLPAFARLRPWQLMSRAAAVKAHGAAFPFLATSDLGGLRDVTLPFL